MSLAVVEAVQKGKYQPYPEYKNSGSTWFSDLPSHWTRILLKRVVLKVCDGTHGTYPRVNDGMPLLSAKNVFSDGLLISDSESQISFEHYSEIVSNGFPAKDDVLVTCVGTIGRCYVYDFDYPMAFQRSVAFLRLIDLAVPQFYKYYIESHPYQSQLKSIVKSSAQGGVYMGDLVATESVLPPKEEQCSIAAFLDYETARIDRLIAQQQRLIELLKEKRQAVISHAVTKGLNPNAPMKDSGVEWLGQVPEHWVVTALKRYWGVVDCKHITAEFIDDGIPLASIREVQSWEVDLSNAKQTSEEYYNALIDGGRIPENGDIIYSRNATVGEAARVTAEHPRFAMGQDVCLLKRIRKCIDTDFFMYQLKSRIISYQLDTLMVGSTFKRINVDDIRNFVVVVPPEDEAVAIRSYLNDFDRKYKNIEQSASRQVSLLQERRTALISAAVTGKIDLRGWTPPAEEVAA